MHAYPLTANGSLTTMERSELGRLERTIETSLDSFLATGYALADIRNLRLYRAAYKTFEAYLESRWGFSRSRGYQLIACAEVSTVVGAADLTERAARVLTGQPANVQRDVYGRATENGQTPTAAVLSDLLRQVEEEEAACAVPPASRSTGRRPAGSGELDERCRHYGRVIGKLFARLDGTASGLSPEELAWLEENPFAK